MFKRTILITGISGFIGSHLAAAILAQYPDCHVVGLDIQNHVRLQRLKAYTNFTWVQGDIINKETVTKVFATYHPDAVIHLAAQAGVRRSTEQPDLYVQTNIVGFHNILETCRRYPVMHLLYASSSSVYDNASLYAATKSSDEILAQVYANLYQIPTTGMRFFTVYGPWGRPDMAYYHFTQKLLKGETVELFNHGQNQRDFTYIDDLVKCIIALVSHIPSGHRIYDIGKGQPEDTVTLIRTIHTALIQQGCLPPGDDITKRFIMTPAHAAEAVITCADTKPLLAEIGFVPTTTLKDGIPKFVAWYIQNMVS